ncbi:MAG: GNAT family N-acetyltransferase [Oscillospiraceae bacterium]|nr:GNAT family N-acetyltransferase [Oscillospiraceae bacterium]
MIIRKATIQDIEQLRPLYIELERDAVIYQPEHFVIGYRDDGFFNSIFKSDTQDILVAECESGIVGFCHIMISHTKNVSCLKEQTYAYIQDLVVSEERRNCGIGTKLMAASKEYGRKHGAEFIRLSVFPKNISGLRFYERDGFCEMMKTLECSI